MHLTVVFLTIYYFLFQILINSFKIYVFISYTKICIFIIN